VLLLGAAVVASKPTARKYTHPEPGSPLPPAALHTIAKRWRPARVAIGGDVIE
jgi:hypothetical protein